MTDKTDAHQFHPWPSIICPRCDCGLLARLPEGFKSSLLPAVLSAGSPLARILQDVARWEYQCGGCLTHVTVYAESAQPQPETVDLTG